MLVKPVSLVPRNPADSWGIAESDDKEAETKSETARHAAPVQKAAADNLADRCRLRKQTSETAWHAVPAHSAAADSLADRCRLRNQTSETARHARPAHSAAADSLADRCRLRNQTSETARHARPAHDSRRRALEGFKACKTPKASKRA